MARKAVDLCPIDSLAEQAAEKTLARLGARKLATCQAPVLFKADVAKSLIGSFVAAISGGNLYRQASFLLNQLEEKIFPDFMRIHEQPHLPCAIGSAPFDREGVRTVAKDLVSAGVLQSYVLSSYSARRLGLQTTGNAGGVYNLTVHPSAGDLSELLRHMDRGLLVTELLGHGSNIVTGDYSRGASGFWVEDGVIQYPVEGITIAGNLRDIYRNIIATGSDLDRRSSIQTGSLLIEQLTIAGG